MTKLLTIDVNFDKSKGEFIYSVNVIANDQENILILKDLIEDREKRTNIHCLGVKLHHTYNYCYELLPAICAKGEIFIRCIDNDVNVPEAVSTIEKIIKSFIL